MSSHEVHIFNLPIRDEPTKISVSNWSKHKELLSYWSIYLNILHMIGQSNMNERLYDMTQTVIC